MSEHHEFVYQKGNYGLCAVVGCQKSKWDVIHEPAAPEAEPRHDPEMVHAVMTARVEDIGVNAFYGKRPAEPPAVPPAQEREHRLKTWKTSFEAIMDGRKRFEIRVNDRNFQVGDTLILNEWYPDVEAYSGRSLSVRVNYIAQGVFGLPANLCVMSFELVQPSPQPASAEPTRYSHSQDFGTIPDPYGSFVLYDDYAALRKSQQECVEALNDLLYYDGHAASSLDDEYVTSRAFTALANAAKLEGK